MVETTKEQKWYSDGLTSEKISADGLNTDYAVIVQADAVSIKGNHGEDIFGVRGAVSVNDNDYGYFSLTSPKDITRLLRETDSQKVSDLVGLVVGIHFTENPSVLYQFHKEVSIKGLSIPETIPYKLIKKVLEIARKKKTE